MIKENSYRNYLITNIAGGLGNQLFCYYSSLSFAKSKNLDLYIDDYGYNFYRKDRLFALDKYKINFRRAKKNILKKFKYIPFSKYDEYLIKYLNLNVYLKDRNIIIENEDDKFEDVLKKIKKDSYIQGYWQNISFLKNVKSTMREEIKLLHSSNVINDLLLKINKTNSCSIHIRRGDYLKEPFNKIYQICSEKYYHEGINLVQKRIIDPFYFVFTDDIDWAKETLRGLSNKILINDYKLKDYEEFYLLSKCQNHIISNSTFSLIGAWLHSDNNLVIEPKNWFKKKESGNKILNQWIKLEN